MSKLLFRTQPGSVIVPAGQTKELGTVDVSTAAKIRIVADERVGGSSDVTVRLTIMEGNELVGPLDEFTLRPHSNVTRVYDVPGTKIGIFADAKGTKGTDGLDVLVYGS